MKPTRYYSSKQEDHVAKMVNGRRTANSGATAFSKGDVRNELFLIECKTVTKDVKSVAIKKEWLDKNKEESFAMNKPYSALAFNYGPELPNYYVIDERLFVHLVELLKEENNV